MKNRLLFALLLFVLAAPAARADVLNTSATWTSWTPIGATNTTVFGSSPYWHNQSWDGNGCNIGQWLTNDGRCTGYADFYKYSPKTTASYLGTGDATFYFGSEAGSVTSMMGAVGVSALSAGETFGIYDYSNPANKTAVLTGASFGTTAPFTVPSGNYGFYATVTDGSGTRTFYSGGLDSNNRARFTVFNLSTDTERQYAIGFEDIGGTNEASDYDYNDFIFFFKSESTPVPEPATVALMGGGLLGMAMLVRRRRQR